MSNLSPAASAVMREGGIVAKELHSDSILPLHLLLALLRFAHGAPELQHLATTLRSALGVPLDVFFERLAAEGAQDRRRFSLGAQFVTPKAANILATGSARRHAILEGSDPSVSFADILLGVLQDPCDELARTVASLRIDLKSAVQAVASHVSEERALAEALRRCHYSYRTGDFAAAAVAYANVLEEWPQHGAAHYFRARALAFCRAHQEAIAVYQSAIEYLQGPDKAAALEGRASSHVELSDLAAAIGDLTAAIALRPSNVAHLYVMRGKIHLRLNQADAATTDFAAARAEDPDDADAAYWLGTARREAGDREAASELMHQATKLGHPNAGNDTPRPHLFRRVARWFSNPERQRLRSIRRTLRSADMERRTQAIAVLAQMESPAATTMLIELLQDEDVRSRDASIVALGQMRSWRATPSLLRLLDDAQLSEESRNHVLNALGRIRDLRALPAWFDVMRREETDVRDLTVEHIAKVGVGAIDTLREEHRKGSAHVSKAIVSALERINEPQVAALLLEIMEDPSLRDEARTALENLHRVDEAAMIPYLTHWWIAPTVADRLRKVRWQPPDDRHAVHLLLAMRDGGPLREHWDEVKAILLDDIRSGQYRVVENALYGFIGLGREGTIRTLIDTLEKDGDKVMAEAFLNAGQSELEDAAREWAAARGYVISRGPGARPVSWGSL